ncbi:MAG TPA: DEAD/DEAH box helicase [Patescibacteria group bacterium]|nr:DEAD/DEAH box helicase [Patescibacteria group bacterium]
MYKPKQNNAYRGKHGGGFYSSRKKFQRGFAKHADKLDTKLFVKKAEERENANLSLLDEAANGSFIAYPIVDKLKRNIQEHGYTIPTAIQEKAIPEILAGRDIIGIANTGTGKTAAFLIALINKAYLDRNQRVLIVTPTRELALQITDEFRVFAKGTDLEAAALVGGSNIKKQTYALHHKPHFVIGTPGRLKDLLIRKDLNVGLFQNVVLDEVDRMVDIGFIKDIKFLISLLPKTRQSLFFSATVDTKTQEILRSFVTDPITISVKQQDTSATIDQDIIKVTGGKTKINVLHDLLIQTGFDKVLIFGRTKWGVQKLANELISRGFHAAAIHGNKTQNQRQRALQQFKSNEIQVLLATDVVSRGLDIENVTHVINYDAPASYEDYIHRIGRTGRAGKRGTALTFVD